MKTQMNKNVEVNVFDMYGLTDVRAVGFNRVGQVSRNNGCWTLHLYFIKNANLSGLHEARTFDNKQVTVEAAKAWVVFGR